MRHFVLDPYRRSSAGSGWNPSDKTTNIVLSSSDQVASLVSNSGGVRGVASRSAAGDFYFEIAIASTAPTDPIHGCGVSTAGVNLTWSSATAWGWYNHPQAPLQGKINNGSITAYTVMSNPPKRIGVRVNAGDLIFYQDGVSAGTAFSGLSGSVFPNWGNTGSNAATHSATLYTSAAQLLYLPSGSTAWG